MTGDFTAVGEVATGVLIARAVEPSAGEAGQSATAGWCRNCGTALAGSYCHACGQAAHVRRTLGALGHDPLHGVLHFEGKTWRTLPLLVFRPGELTRRYIAGERARFVSPLALFLFSVFLLFATFGVLGSSDWTKGLERGGSLVSTGWDKTEAANAQALAALEAERIRTIRAGGDARAIDTRIATQREEIVTFARLRDKAAGRRGEQVTGWVWLDHGIAKARANPSLVVYKMQSSAYKYSWALIPLSTPLVALLFLWRRRFTLYDHAIFVIYSISFISLLVIALELLAAIGAPAWVIVWSVLLGVPAHMFVQLRGAYGLSRFSAGWRTLFLLGASLTVMLLFALAVTALGLS